MVHPCSNKLASIASLAGPNGVYNTSAGKLARDASGGSLTDPRCFGQADTEDARRSSLLAAMPQDATHASVGSFQCHWTFMVPE